MRGLLRFAAIIVAFALAPAAPATTFVVSNTADSGPGSLRQAMLDANAAQVLAEREIHALTFHQAAAATLQVASDALVAGQQAGICPGVGGAGVGIFVGHRIIQRLNGARRDAAGHWP